MRVALYPILIALGLIGILAAPLADDRTPSGCYPSIRTVAPDIWPGWRGAAAQGTSSATLPTQWSARDHIRWKTAIPGRGHSSPIVYGDRVYVTTAVVTVGGALLERALRLLALGLVFVVVSLALRTVAEVCRAEHPPTSKALAMGTLTLTLALVLAGMACCGDELFDLARSPIRAWIVSVAFASLCLTLTAVSVDRRGVRWIVAAIATGVAVVALAGFPFQQYTFYRGIPSLRPQIALATAALPLLVGVGSMCGACVRRWPSATRRIVIAGLVIVATVIAALLVHRVLVFRDDGFPDVRYAAQLSPWLLLLPAASIATWYFRGKFHGSPTVNLALVVGGALSIVVTVAMAIELIASRSPYLAYHLGTPRVPPLGGTMLATVGAGAALDAMWSSRPGIRRRWVSDASLPAALGLVTVVLGALFFLRVNFVHRYTSMARAIVSLDRHSGGVQWIARALEGPHPVIDGRNSPATPTPVTDGQFVCGYFGTAGLMCATKQGRIAWTRSDLAYDGTYGVGFSPVLADGLLIVASDQPNGLAVVQAIDVQTGTSVWVRRFTTTPTWSGNNRTPLVHEKDGKKTLVLWGMEYVKALSLRSGETMWEFPLTSGGDLVASAVADDDRLYLSSVGGTVALDHADLAAGRNPVRWRSKAAANCASPVLVNGLLFTVTDAGVAAAIDASTGDIAWRHRLPGQYFASLVASPTAVYFTNNEGTTTVVAADRTFRILGRNHLQDETMASMAPAGCQLFIRSAGHVYAIEGQ